MNCSLGKQMLQSVNEGVEIIENTWICRLKDPDSGFFEEMDVKEYLMGIKGGLN